MIEPARMTTICPICREPVAMTLEGRIAPHNTTFVFNGATRRKRCPGGARRVD